VQQGSSLEAQEAAIGAYATSIGAAIDETFIEAGVSGAKSFARRSRGGALYKVVQAGDIIIATKLDRMFRSAKDALEVVEQFQKRGIHLHLMDVGGDVTGNGVAKLVFSILASVAEMERNRIGERVRDVKKLYRQSGRFSGGKTQVGYEVQRDKVAGQKKLVQKDAWEQVLKYMQAKRQNGESFRSIADWVTKHYGKSGIQMSPSSCYRIFKRQVAPPDGLGSTGDATEEGATLPASEWNASESSE
jgi:DNA invertase Pin-like site-specific DNA recombinase